MSIRWFRNKYLVKITPCLHFLMMYNYVMLLYELVRALKCVIPVVCVTNQRECSQKHNLFRKDVVF